MTTYDPVLLQTLLTVAQTGSFTQAAARLGVRQPTVSQHIGRLEKQTGRTLILRDTHSVALTPDGEAMIGFARSILAAHEQATAYFSGTRPRGRLRIGMSDDLALTRLPQILRDFRQDYPLVDFDLTVDQSGTLNQRRRRRLLDRTREVVDRAARRWVWEETRANERIEARLDDIVSNAASPYEVAAEVLKSLKQGDRR